MFCPGCSGNPGKDHICHRGVLGTFSQILNSTNPKHKNLQEVYPRALDTDALSRVASRASTPGYARDVLREYPPNASTQQAAIDLFTKLGYLGS
jgi:hypothetical protein